MDRHGALVELGVEEVDEEAQVAVARPALDTYQAPPVRVLCVDDLKVGEDLLDLRPLGLPGPVLLVLQTQTLEESIQRHPFLAIVHCNHLVDWEEAVGWVGISMEGWKMLQTDQTADEPHGRHNSPHEE